MRTVRMIRIPADLGRPVEQLELVPEYNQFVDAIGGGWLESVTLPEAVAYFDEEGKLKGLPVNVRATAVWQTYRPTPDVLCGDVILCGWDLPTDTYHDIPPEVEFRCLAAGRAVR